MSLNKLAEFREVSTSTSTLKTIRDHVQAVEDVLRDSIASAARQISGVMTDLVSDARARTTSLQSLIGQFDPVALNRAKRDIEEDLEETHRAIKQLADVVVAMHSTLHKELECICKHLGEIAEDKGASGDGDAPKEKRRDR